jgi:hypothetical protein
MKKGNASTKSIVIAIIIIAIIGIVWYMTRSTTSPEPQGELAPAPATDDPAVLNQELENLQVDDIESELQDITNQIEQF